MEKVKYESVKSAVISMTNSVDTERKYAISTNVSISNAKVNSVSDGVVKALDETSTLLATFNRNEWEKGKLHCTFSDCDESAVIAAIKSFLDECEAAICGGVEVVIAENTGL